MSKSNITSSLCEIAAQSQKGLTHQIDQILKLGLTIFDLDIAIVAKIDDDRYEVIQKISPKEMELKTGDVFETGRTFCSETLKANGPVTYPHVANSKICNHPAYSDLKLEAYAGVPIRIADKTYGTLNFSSPSPKDRNFSEDEIDALRLMGLWLSSEMERNNYLNELKDAHNQLLESQKYYESIFESIGNSIIIVDEESKIITMNKKTEEYFGYKREELSGLKIEKLIPPRYRKKHEQLRSEYGKAPANRPMGMGRELLAMKKDGSEVYVEVGLTPISTTRGKLVIATLIDISRRRKLEEERDELFLDLKDALDNVKTLTGMLPICMNCKKVRDDKGYWEKVDSYLVKHSDATITHGLCPDCAQKLYPDFYKKKK